MLIVKAPFDLTQNMYLAPYFLAEKSVIFSLVTQTFDGNV